MAYSQVNTTYFFEIIVEGLCYEFKLYLVEPDENYDV